MKKVLTSFVVLVMLLLSAGRLVAQSPTFRAISSGGGTEINGGLSVSYTIGQASFAVIGGGGDMNAGFQQVFCIPSLDTLEMAVCQGSVFDFGDFKEVTTSVAGYQEHMYMGLDHLGCDSIVFLHLTVLPTSDTALDVNVCQGSAYSFSNIGRIVTSVSGKYEYVDSLKNVFNCDSVVALHLTIDPAFDTTYVLQATDSFEWRGFTYYESVAFDTLISNEAGCDTIAHVQLSLLHNLPIPTIYSYNDRVLIALRTTADGDTVIYAAYRWFKNGRPTTNIMHDTFFYQPFDGSKLDGCYYLEVATDATEQNWVRSNTLCFGSMAGVNEVEENVALTLRPNPVAHGQILHVSIDADESLLQGAKIMVFDLQGRKVVQRAAMQENEITTAFAAGVYSVHVVLSSGKHETRKLVVR